MTETEQLILNINQVGNHKGHETAEIKMRSFPEGNNDKMLSQDYKIKVNLKTIREIYPLGNASNFNSAQPLLNFYSLMSSLVLILIAKGQVQTQKA